MVASTATPTSTQTASASSAVWSWVSAAGEYQPAKGNYSALIDWTGAVKGLAGLDGWATAGDVFLPLRARIEWAPTAGARRVVFADLGEFVPVNGTQLRAYAQSCPLQDGIGPFETEKTAPWGGLLVGTMKDAQPSGRVDDCDQPAGISWRLTTYVAAPTLAGQLTINAPPCAVAMRLRPQLGATVWRDSGPFYLNGLLRTGTVKISSQEILDSFAGEWIDLRTAKVFSASVIQRAGALTLADVCSIEWLCKLGRWAP